jgi:hypothetical protein
VNLSELHREAILQLGNTASGHEFLTTEVLEELLALGLIYWRAPDNLDFTPVGEKVFKELEAE